MKHLKCLLIAVFATFILTGVASAESDTNESSTVIEISREENGNQANSSQEGASVILRNLERLASDTEQVQQILENYEEIGERKRGFIARVTSLRDDSLRVETLHGNEQFITPDQSTAIVSGGREARANTINLSEWVDVGDWVVIIGVENNGVFSPRRILISASSLEPETQIVKRGSIVALQRASFELQPVATESAMTFNITGDTTFQNADGTALTVDDFGVDSKVLVVGTSNGEDNTATIIRSLTSIGNDEE
ncbi:MAG: hypothetical protein LBG64_01085 [Pseudomonadales bacterium]|jgi:hypothetical protein|nr:hypothetical protein [Pseudomonadales bacterium]